MTLPLSKHRHLKYTSNTAAAAVNDTPFFFFGQYNVCRHLTNYLLFNCFRRRWRQEQGETQQGFMPAAQRQQLPEDIKNTMNRNTAATSRTRGDDRHQPGSSGTCSKTSKKLHHQKQQEDSPSPHYSGGEKITSTPSPPREHNEDALPTQQTQYKRPGARIHVSGPVDFPNNPFPGRAPLFLQAALHTLPTNNTNTAVAFTVAAGNTVGTNTTGNQGIRQHIEMSTKTGVFHLSKAKLEFPAELEKIADALRSIDLSENKINQIPENISFFTNLKHLNLSHNQIEVIPNQLGQLSKLETLSLANNRIKSVPETIAQLQKLRDVNLNSNQLNAFPSGFSSLKLLTVLDLGNNRISQVPDGVGGLQVVELILNHNQVRKVSKDLAQCPNLKTLRLQGNRLEVNGFPKEILSDSPVSLLSLEGNMIDVKQLRDLEGYDQYMERYTQTKKKLA